MLQQACWSCEAVTEQNCWVSDLCTGHVPHNQTCLMVNMPADPAGMMAGLLGCWSGASRTDMHTGRCCCKKDTCETVATHSSCQSFEFQSCMSAGVVLLYLPYLLVWCLTISHAFWCGASLSAMPLGVVPHYRTFLLVWCLTIGHAFWSGASLSFISAAVLSHYRPCLLGW